MRTMTITKLGKLRRNERLCNPRSHPRPSDRIISIVSCESRLDRQCCIEDLDTARGNRNLLQDFAREVGVPAFGAYIGLMSADAVMKRYNKHIVFFCFQ